MVQVDDTTSCGTIKFIELMKNTEGMFDMKNKVISNFTFGGITVQKVNYGYIAHQSSYAATLRKLPKDATFDDFRTMRHKLAWLILTPQDLCTVAIMSSEVTYDTFNAKHV